MTGLLDDLRHAARMLFKNPGLTGISVLALALGIGLTAVMFSIVYGALMRGLPMEGGERVMSLSRANPSADLENIGVTIHDYEAWREQQTSFTHLAAYYTGTVNLRGSERAERFDGAFVTANLFDALGVRPVVGRTFRPEEAAPGAPMSVVLAHHVWMDRYDGDPEVVGRAVNVNGEPGEILGVMPEGFRFPVVQDVWVPLREGATAVERGQGRSYSVFGVLRSGVSADEAMVELDGIAARLAAEFPETNEGVVPTIRPFTEDSIGSEAAALLYTMLATVSLVLLIACTNVANLLLARAALRTKEVGIRTALGAHRLRVIGGMVAEALVLALVGGVLGTAVAWVGIELFARAVEGTDPPYWLVFRLDGPIVLFILGASLVAAVVSGAIPAWKATAGDVTAVLKDESRGTSSLRIGRLSRGLVVGQIAMSVGLLVAAGLMTKSIVTLRNFDYGFRTDVFTARVGLFEADFPESADRLLFFEEVHRRLDALSGVRAAALGDAMPGTGSPGAAFAVEGRSYEEDRDYPFARMAAITPGYFEVFGVEPLLGRDFSTADGPDGMPVAIVNESFARRHFPDGTPLGARIRTGRSESEAPWLTVVGVVPDLFMEGIGNPDAGPEGFYVPLAQSDRRFMSLLARGPADAMALTAGVREAVAAVHADTPLYWVDTLAGRVEQNTWFYEVFGTLFMIFGGVALFLASVGLYGVMAFSVSRRTSEVGIRMALGAEGGQVLAMILRQGMTQTAIGITLGLGLAVLLSRGVALLLFNVSPNDPLVFGTIIGILALTGAVASLLPARRATRVDPVVALRSE